MTRSGFVSAIARTTGTRSVVADGYGRCRHVGAVAADDQVDLVYVEQLGVDARYCRRIGLIVIIDELHGTAEQPAFGIGILFPNLLGEQRGLAVGRKPARPRHA